MQKSEREKGAVGSLQSTQHSHVFGHHEAENLLVVVAEDCSFSSFLSFDAVANNKHT